MNLTGLTALNTVPAKAETTGKVVMVTDGMHGFKTGQSKDSALDNTLAIQKIIDDQDPETMTTLQFPKGYFGISGAIKMHSNLILSGVASKDSKWTNDTHMVALVPTAANGNGYVYNRATWWYPTQAKGYGGPKNVNHVYWNNITFNGGTDKAKNLQELQAITHATDISFDHCDFDRTETAPGHSLDLGGADGVRVTNSTFRGYPASSYNSRKEAVQVDYTILTSSSTNADKNLTVVKGGKILPDPKWGINESAAMDGLPSKNVTVTNSRFLPTYSSGTIMDSPTIDRRAPNPIGQHIQYAGQAIGPITFTGNYDENSMTPGKDALGGKSKLAPNTADGHTVLEKYNGIIHLPNANHATVANNIFRQTQSNPDGQGIIDMTMNYNAGRLPVDVAIHDGKDNDGKETGLKVNTSAPFTQFPVSGAVFNNNTIIGFKGPHSFMAWGHRISPKDHYADLIRGIENKHNTYVNGVDSLAAVKPGPNGNLYTNQQPANYSEEDNQVKTAAAFSTPQIHVKRDKLTMPAQGLGNAQPDYRAYGATVTDKLDDWQDKNQDPITFDDHKVKFDTPGTYDVLIKTSNSLHVENTKKVKLEVTSAGPMIFGDDVTVKVRSTFEPLTALSLAASDKVDGDLTAHIQTSGTVDTSKPGKYEVKATVTNKAGQTSHRTFTVTVGDTQLALTAPAVTLKVGEAFDASDGITATDASGNPVTDLNVTVLNRPDTTKPGHYVVSYLVSAHGLTGAIRRDVNVVTTAVTAPTTGSLTAHGFTMTTQARVPSDQTLIDQARVRLTAGNQAVTAPIHVDATKLNTGKVGDYPVTFTATVNGQPVSQTVIVTVRATAAATDFQVHDFTIDRGQPLTEAQVRQHFTAKDAVAGDVTQQVAIDLSGVNTNQSGDYPVKLTYTANGQVITKTLTVKVAAASVPTLNVHDISMIQGTDVYHAIAQGKFTAHDGRDGNISSQITYDIKHVAAKTPGIYSVTATIRNTDGHEVKRAFQLTVDKDMPVINGPADMKMDFGRKPYTEAEALQSTFATDAVDGDLSKHVHVTGLELLDTQKPGDYTLTYRVTNQFGNTTTKDITVKVLLPIPEITLMRANREGALVLKPGTTADVLHQIQDHVLAKAPHSGPIDSRRLRISADDANLFNNGDYHRSGSYAYTFEITDDDRTTGAQEIKFVIDGNDGQSPNQSADGLGQGGDNHAKPYLKRDAIDYTPVQATGDQTFEATNLQRLNNQLEVLPHNPALPFTAQILSPETIHFDQPGSYKVQVKLANGLQDRVVPLTVNISVKAAIATSLSHLKTEADKVVDKGHQALTHPLETYGRLPQTGKRATLATLALGLVAIVSGTTLLVLRVLRGKSKE